MEIADAVSFDTPAKQAELDPDLAVVLKVLGNEFEGQGAERRRFSRCPYVVRCHLELTDPMGHPYRVLAYSRDANEWGVGVLSQTVLPVGRPALLQIAGGEGTDVREQGCIIRCREILPGWYEGAVLFDQKQPALKTAKIEARGSI